MELLQLKNINHRYGKEVLFEDADLVVEEGERYCLLGRNGTGKSTLLKIAAKKLKPDSGEVIYRKTTRSAYLPQEIPFIPDLTVLDIVMSGSGKAGELLRDYETFLSSGEEQFLKKAQRIQEEIDRLQCWNVIHETEELIGSFQLNKEMKYESLSEGNKRKVLLLKSLMSKPNLLFLDEPTNHMDIGSIEHMENYLKSSGLTLFFVTHDRKFLNNLSSRIVEIDWKRVYYFSGDYDAYLTGKEEVERQKEAEERRLDDKLKKEEAWLRQGIKARRTRNEGRLRKLKELRDLKAKRIRKAGTVNFKKMSVERSGKLLIDIQGLKFSYGEKLIVAGFSNMIEKGDKIGIIGPNGSGKSTLVKLLIGELEPMNGVVKYGTGLKIGYFDQLRSGLDEKKTVRENVCDEGDFIFVDGRRKHVAGYLKDFLFPSERLNMIVKGLSGGEKNRLMMAKLFAQPTNLLILDEPTNDLDMETLELLEDWLVKYSGTVVLISHDRDFINAVVTSSLVIQGNGVIEEHAGGYDDWIRVRNNRREKETVEVKERQIRSEKKKTIKKSLTYQESIDLENITIEIDKLEREKEKLYNDMITRSARDGHEQLVEDQKKINEIEKELNVRYQRWEELELKKEEG